MCLLDPYGLDLDWEVIKTASELDTVKIFLNFPVHDMNRNVPIKDPAKMDSRQVESMDRFWGDNAIDCDAIEAISILGIKMFL